MYAVVDIKGFQYKIENGETLKVPKYDLKVGKKITIPDVLLVSDDKKITVGTPFVNGATVEATITGHGKHKKIVVFKKKKRKDYSVKKGHRQAYTEIHIAKINTVSKEATPAPAEKKEVKETVAND